MTRFGVSDDDMPESPPPPVWGPASFDERDLDAVLDGNTGDVSSSLRPVVDALAALNAGPVPAELWGEADAMAEFRALGLGHAELPARPAAAPTLLLEAQLAGQRPGGTGRRPARHRRRPSRRHPVRSAILRPAALCCAAAAAVIVFAVLVTGNVTTPFRAIAHMASTSARTPSAAGSTSAAAPRVETSSAAHEPTTPPSVTPSTVPAPSVASICRAYYTDFEHPEGLSAWATERTLYGELAAMAHSDNWFAVAAYCAEHTPGLFPDGAPTANKDQSSQQSAHPGPGDQGNGLGQQGAPAAEGSKTGSGSTTVSGAPASGNQVSNAQGSSK